MKRRAVARIDESRCIGCAQCIAACPVDAIIGARGLMHTVAEPWCIGCRLCLPPCPVDCIDMIALPTGSDTWTRADSEGARRRARLRKLRLEQARTPAYRATPDRRRVIAQALERARRKRGAA
ncbi:MAG TPA: RnfABCDGE type electron transport complex subunit B [Burkholderiales bacterium]|nr:RnfABCDGE type electron transport complex subunit B [Burkholderiales bacterium]